VADSKNSKLFCLKKKTDYYDRMIRMIDGIDLEFQGHMGKDRHVIA
jgi:dsDNA-binding SOS-regulon protein